MSRAKQITEKYAEISCGSSVNKVLNEKIEITSSDADKIKDAFSKIGKSIEVNFSTSGHVYINGLYECCGRYVGIDFDQGGFRLRIKSSGGDYSSTLLPVSECGKFLKELEEYTKLLEKLGEINKELV